MPFIIKFLLQIANFFEKKSIMIYTYLNKWGWWNEKEKNKSCLDYIFYFYNF